MALKALLGVGLLLTVLMALAVARQDPADNASALAPAAAASSQSQHSASAHGAGAAPAKPATWRLGTLTLTACDLAQPNTGLSTPAWCAKFPVPENRADPHSRKIELNLAVLRSSSPVADPDMLVFLAGGPGQAATEAARTIAPVFGPLLAHHHVLLLDQRGTGGSNALDCPKQDDTGAGDTGTNLDAATVRRDALGCLAAVRHHADPRYYTTTEAVQDLEDVRRALGAPSFDLVGVSYGTRVAQQYLRSFPD